MHRIFSFAHWALCPSGLSGPPTSDLPAQFPRQLLTGGRCRLFLAALSLWLLCPVVTADEPAGSSGHVVLTIEREDGSSQQVQGRVTADLPDGRVMLEDAAGTINTFPAAVAATRREVAAPFAYLSTEQMAGLLLRQMGAGFEAGETEHFVLCSQTDVLYTEYCGKLLERVHSEFYEYCGEHDLSVAPLATKLPVVIFRDAASLQEFARRQHPETDFSQVPGYYSLRYNQMLLSGTAASKTYRRASDVAREVRKNRREVETLVHEATHQLAYNSGLQVRYADNPVWLSEGLAVYFESTSGRSSLGWSRPGEVSRLHLPTLKPTRPLAAMPVSFTALATSLQPFENAQQAAYAYAESWAIVHYLTSRRPDGLAEMLRAYQEATPGVGLGAARHAEILESALGEALSDGEQSVLKHVQRLRKPR